MEKEHYLIPMVPLRGLVVYPNTVINFEVGRDTSIVAVNRAIADNSYLFLATQIDMKEERPSIDDIYSIGVVCKVKHVIKTQDGTLRVLATGVSRAVLNYCNVSDNYYHADVTTCIETPIPEDQEKAYMRSLIEKCKEYSIVTGKFTMETIYAMQDIKSQQELVDTIALTVIPDIDDKQKLLQILDVESRYKEILSIIDKEIKISLIEQEISDNTRQKIDKLQREAYLREQLHSIQESLGDTTDNDVNEFKSKLDKISYDEETKSKLYKELDKMERMNPQSPDYNVMYNYFEWVTSLPVGKYTEDQIDLKKAKKILDQNHFGMEKVKDRILEYISVYKLTGKKQGNTLCFVGPPGVGKTSIASSIAEAIGKKFVRMSLGGVKDEAEIRGHRRTYIGAVPGRIVSNIRRAESMNPVFLLDEIDKMASDMRGDPTSAMLEVLDESVNKSFQDHYLDIDFDLSQVMFICTANNAEDIPAPLYDRMEIIDLESYTPYEKEQIAVKHLVPKEIERNGLNKQNFKINRDAIKEIIANYTAESGVRSLERQIGEICRKAAKEILENGENISVKKKDVVKYLGKQKHFDTKLPDEACEGVAIGLAWTASGGTTLPVEVVSMEGSGNIELTGQLGDVMKESARIAISHVRTVASKYGISPEFNKNNDIHIHFPEGAIPKDGPSAGITMATAVLSALTGIKVRRDIAMTGEITLNGRVLPIGGLREKTFAAHRAGIREIIIPKDNVNDIEEIPEEIRKGITFHPVSKVGQVFDLALMKE